MNTLPGPSSPAHPSAPARDANRPLLVRAYRRLAPRRFRRAVVATVPAGFREGVKRVLARVSAVFGRLDRTREERELYRYAPPIGPDRTVITSRGVARAALVVPDPTPLEARSRNLRMVTDALTEAGIDFFTVRGYAPEASAVGVNEADRAATLQALAELCRRVPGYVSHVSGLRVPTGLVLGAVPGTWDIVAESRWFRFSCYHVPPSRTLVLGSAHGCDIEFWSVADGVLVAPRANRAAETVPLRADAVEAPEHVFTRLATERTPGLAPRLTTREEFVVPLPDEVAFPVDAVYTWVDGDDPAWQRRRAEVTDQPYHGEAANDARYLCRDELRYSLRSLHAYAPWIRHVYLVTDQQVPSWLDRSYPGITVVDHRDIFSDPALLPTFNSHAIESQLHHIEGLAEHFLYINDDVFLGNPLTPEHFFVANGMAKFFTSRALIPTGPPTATMPPVSVAGINNRGLIRQRFGTVPTRKMKHVPHPLRRSVLAEIEKVFPDEHRATASHRIRDIGDISIPSSLHHYYGFHTGASVESHLRYDYYDLTTPDIADRLRKLLKHRNQQAFCLNDTLSTTADFEVQAGLLASFLPAYFPSRSPFEKPDTSTAGVGAPREEASGPLATTV